VWQEVVGRLAAVENRAKRARLAIAILGDEGARIALPHLNAGASGLRTSLRAAQSEQEVAAARAAAKADQAAARAARATAQARRVNARETRREVRAFRQAVRVSELEQRVRRSSIAVYNRVRGAVDRMTAAYRRNRAAIAATRDVAARGGGGGITSGMLQAAFWTGLARSIAHTTMRLTELAARGTALFAGRVFGLTTWAESARKALGMISGFGEDAGGAEFEKARRSAVELGLALEPAIDGYKRLRGVGFGAAEALDLTKLVADMQAGLGLTTETTDRVLLALGQIKGAGRLQGDELRQLQETGLSVDRIWESISEQLGVTVQQAMKLKEQGKVSADVAIKAVREATLKTLGTTESGEAAGRLVGETMRGQLSKAKSTFDSWMLSLGQDLEPKFNSIAKTIGASLGKFDKDGTFRRITEAITRLFGDFIDLVEIHWPRIERILKRAGLGAADGLNDLASSLDHLIDKFLSAVEWIQDHWEGVKTTVVAGAAAMAAALAGIAVASVINAIATIAGGLRSAGAAARSAASGVWKLVEALRARNRANAAGGVPTPGGTPTPGGKAAGAAAAGAGRGALALASGVGLAVGAALLTTGDESETQRQRRAERQRKNPNAGLSAEGIARRNARLKQRAEASSIGNVSRQYQAPEIAPVIRLPRAAAERNVTLTDRRTVNVNVGGGAQPAATGRAVASAVSRTQRQDLGALRGALVGAGRD
jgi:tape measure domain-containing protein